MQDQTPAEKNIIFSSDNTNNSSVNKVKTEALLVSKSDAGQKLLSFLARRYIASNSDLHKIIRSGQVRINSLRVKAFVRISEGDLIRVPPFLKPKLTTSKDKSFSIIADNADFMVVNKPAGLASHAGTEHEEDNLASELLDPALSFQPSMVHRLDKDSSGLILVAKNYQTLRAMQDCLALRSNEYSIRKEYLVWVHGNYPIYDHFDRLEDQIFTENNKENNFERQAVLKKSTNSITNQVTAQTKSQEAISYVRSLAHNQQLSLLQVVLITGRKHQIRIQLSSRNFYLVGDNKYAKKNSPKATESLKLHAARLIINNKIYEALPDWQDIYKVETLPSPSTISNLHTSN